MENCTGQGKLRVMKENLKALEVKRNGFRRLSDPDLRTVNFEESPGLAKSGKKNPKKKQDQLEISAESSSDDLVISIQTNFHPDSAPERGSYFNLDETC